MNLPIILRSLSGKGVLIDGLLPSVGKGGGSGGGGILVSDRAFFDRQSKRIFMTTWLYLRLEELRLPPLTSIRS